MSATNAKYTCADAQCDSIGRCAIDMQWCAVDASRDVECCVSTARRDHCCTMVRAEVRRRGIELQRRVERWMSIDPLLCCCSMIAHRRRLECCHSIVMTTAHRLNWASISQFDSSAQGVVLCAADVVVSTTNAPQPMQLVLPIVRVLRVCTRERHMSWSCRATGVLSSIVACRIDATAVEMLSRLQSGRAAVDSMFVRDDTRRVDSLARYSAARRAASMMRGRGAPTKGTARPWQQEEWRRRARSS